MQVDRQGKSKMQKTVAMQKIIALKAVRCATGRKDDQFNLTAHLGHRNVWNKATTELPRRGDEDMGHVEREMER